MSELDHYCCAVLMTCVGEVAHPQHHFIFVSEQIIEYRRAIACDSRGTRGQCQCNTCLRPFDVIRTIASLRHTVLRVCWLVRCCHYPVPERQVLELKWLQQRIA